MREIIKRVESLIDKTPTGELRNELTEINILLHQKEHYLLRETRANRSREEHDYTVGCPDPQDWG